MEKIDVPRTSVGLVGFMGHGKTVYLTSLFYTLKFFQSNWPGYHYLSLDNNTHRLLYEHVRHFEENAELPPSTPVNFPAPTLISYSRFPIFGDYFVTYYDVGGEVYEDVSRINDQGRFVAHADTILFLISISEFGSLWTTNIQKRLDLYVNAVNNTMRVDLKNKQNLIVVLTKADLLVGTALPENLKKYLLEGDYSKYLDLRAAKRNLQMVSRSIREWLFQQDAGGFVNMAEKHFKRVEYCLVSATGAAPIQGKLVSKLNPKDPKRMLDPFLWALSINKPITKLTWPVPKGSGKYLAIALFVCLCLVVYWKNNPTMSHIIEKVRSVSFINRGNAQP